ncbi:hypothetical protein GCM10017556_56100 [Micromonospora sagamiensis]|nr:hypothetical protein GCM10017556_56100 [Micromonospora sagamiensis]
MLRSVLTTGVTARRIDTGGAGRALHRRGGLDPRRNHRRAPSERLRMDGTRRDPAQSRGEQVEQAEREAAKDRLLAQADAERIPVEETTRAVPDRRWRRDRG